MQERILTICRLLVLGLTAISCASIPGSSEVCPRGSNAKTGAPPLWTGDSGGENTHAEWCEVTSDGRAVPDGRFRTWTPGGEVAVEGEMERGLPTGEWTIFLRDDNGEDLGYQRLPFKAGVAHGRSTTFSARGKKLYEVFFQEGVLDGTSTAWFPSGTKKSEMVHREGVLNGPSRTFFDGGKLSSEVVFSNGERDGQYRRWHPNGILRTEGSYGDGDRIGAWRYYDSSGNLTKEEELEGGELVQLLFVVEGEMRELPCPKEARLVKGEMFEEPFDSWISCKKTSDDGTLIAHGCFIEWIEDVLMGTTGQFVDGERHGRWIFRDRTGREEGEAEYEHGVLLSHSGIDPR
jgi:antitoxin component YwqK of YwqJK toxin-antitoxin module